MEWRACKNDNIGKSSSQPSRPFKCNSFVLIRLISAFSVLKRWRERKRVRVRERELYIENFERMERYWEHCVYISYLYVEPFDIGKIEEQFVQKMKRKKKKEEDTHLEMNSIHTLHQEALCVPASCVQAKGGIQCVIMWSCMHCISHFNDNAKAQKNMSVVGKKDKLKKSVF